MATTAHYFDARGVPVHTRAYRWRRFWNWFPLGFGYASLMFMRYILNTTSSALGEKMMSVEDFSTIFSIGAASYVVGFLTLSPLIDRKGGRWGMLLGVSGAASATALMGLVLYGNATLGWREIDIFSILLVLYAINMFFQSCGAASIVTTKLPWFHVRHRGTFGTLFGFMISLGIYFAFDWGYALMSATRATIDPAKMGFWAKTFQSILGTGGTGVDQNWWMFFVPALFALPFLVLMFLFLRNKPSEAGFEDFDTGDQHVSSRSLSIWKMIRELFTNPKHRVLKYIIFIEFASGAIRNGTIQYYPLFGKAVGFWHSFWVGSNWGLALLLCGCLGAYATGQISDRYFQSRRGPMSLFLYVAMFASLFLMVATIGSHSANAGSWTFACGLFVILTGVIGVHGILSGTATGDFAGIENTAKSVGIVDGAVYAGTSLQAFLAGQFAPVDQTAKNSENWISWPLLLLPFAFMGIVLCAHIYKALPQRKPTLSGVAAQSAKHTIN
jgi:OPA family glycerol-3-phosphate transporter-like MFS transporter